jgi:hypothetical protein
MVQARGWHMGFAVPLIWLWPALSPIIANTIGYELAPVIIGLALVWFWQTDPTRATAHQPNTFIPDSAADHNPHS